jgi:hypothetical protein
VICLTCFPLKLFCIFLFQMHQHPCWSVCGDHSSPTHPLMTLFSTLSVWASRTSTNHCCLVNFLPMY